MWSMLLLLVLTTWQLGEGTLCPNFSTEGEPRFTQHLAHADSVRLSHSVPLVCCAAGVDGVTWYRRDVGAGNHPWQSYPPSDDDRVATAEEQGQVMRIHGARTNDNTTFKCELVKGGKPVKSNEIRLYVLICDHLARGPFLMDPFPVDKTIDRFGGNLTFPCTGYFGCSDDAGSHFERIVRWQVKGEFGRDISNISKRYSEIKHSYEGDTRLQSILTIQSVSKEDLGRTFVCQLATPQIIQGQSSIDVHIRKKEKPDYRVIYVVVGSVAASLVFIFLVVCIVRHQYGPQIRVAMESRIKILAQKPIEDEAIEHNAFLYHAPDDTAVATEIKQHLENNNLITKISHDITGNRCELTEVQQGIEKSAVVLFLYSQNLREDKLANVVINSLVRESMEKPIVFIQMDKYDPEEALNWNKEAQIRENDGGREMLKLKADTYGASDVQTDGEPSVPTAAPAINGTLDLKFWKYLPRCKYPDKDSSERVKNNFWCSLRHKIPKFKHQVELQRRVSNKSNEYSSIERGAKGRSSESTKPLLESPATSPLYIENKACSNTTSPVSPEKGVIFMYDEPFPGNSPAPYTYPGRSPAQYSCSDDSVGDRSSAVIVNVDVHQTSEKGDDATQEKAHGHQTKLNAQSDKNNTVVMNNEREGESSNSLTMPLSNGFLNKERTTEVPSDNHDHEEGMFDLSGEESQPICNGMEDNSVEFTHPELTRDQQDNGVNGNVRTEDNYSDRSQDQQGFGDENVRTELQKGALKVETNNVNPKLLATGCSTESGYTSMSPERQTEDMKPNFQLQGNVDNAINV